MKNIQVLKPKFRVDECLSEIKECLDLGWTGMGYKTIEFEDQELKVGLNFINLLDESAPLLYDSPDFSFDTRLHDPRGRLINFSVELNL